MKFSKKQAIRRLSGLHLSQLPAGIMLGVLMVVLPACAETEESPTEPSQELPQEGEMDSQTDLEFPTSESPTDSETVMVRGEVLQMLTPQVALIGDELNGEVLVVSESELGVAENELVEITGVMSSLSLPEADQTYSLNLGTEIDPELMDTPIIVAQAPYPGEQNTAPFNPPMTEPGSGMDSGFPGSPLEQEQPNPDYTEPQLIKPEPETEEELPTSDSSAPNETIMVRGEVLEVLNPQAILIRDEVNGEVLIVSESELDLAEKDLVEVVGVLSNLSLSEAQEAYGLEFPTEAESQLANTPIVISLALR